MWSLAKGYIERRNVFDGTIIALDIPETHLDSHFNVPEWTSKLHIFYALNMIWRYWRHVAMQPNHWRVRVSDDAAYSRWTFFSG